jgi:hypothetical protein
MIRWLRRRNKPNPKTLEIKYAEARARERQEEANRELVSAKKLANALVKIRRDDPFGESFAKVFEGD